MKKKTKKNHDFRDSVIVNVFDLVKLNLIFAVCCLSVIGIPAGINAMTKVNMQIRKGDTLYVVGDFLSILRKDFIQSTLCGLLILAVGLLFGFIFWFYATMQSENSLILTAVRWMTLIPLLILYCASCWLWVMNNMIDLPFSQRLRNAVLLSMICLKESGICLLVGALVCVVTYFGIPYTMPFLLVFGLAFWNYTCVYYTQPMIEKHIVCPPEDPPV